MVDTAVAGLADLRLADGGGDDGGDDQHGAASAPTTTAADGGRPPLDVAAVTARLRTLEGEVAHLRAALKAMATKQRQFHRLHEKQLQHVRDAVQTGVDASAVKRAIRKAHFDFNVDVDDAPAAAVAPTADGTAGAVAAGEPALRIPKLLRKGDLPAGPERVPSPAAAMFTPIGYLDSVFVTKNGTPRQGFACPHARARLTIDVGANSFHYVDGLAAYSHVWLLFLFHDNGGGIGLRAKVQPPMLDGEKTGLFATRSPHRPNPIGLSLCRLDRVKGATLHLSAVDLIHGTPVLDVKPYLPRWDSVPEAEVRTPEWIASPRVRPLTVRWTDDARAALHALGPDDFRLFPDAATAAAAIEDVLRSDPRSIGRRQHTAAKGGEDERFRFALDRVDVRCVFAGTTVTVVGIDLLPRSLDVIVTADVASSMHV